MGPVGRLALAMSFALGVSAGVASAATTAAQLVELSRAGLGDDILIALIQTDGSTFQLTAADILALHGQGLSDRVIRAMQETGRTPPSAPVRPAAVALPVAREVADDPAPAPAPATVNVYQTVTQNVEAPGAQAFQPYYSIPVFPVYASAPIVPARHVIAPIYWGWGGQRRPDSWQPIHELRSQPTNQPRDMSKGRN